MVVEVKGFSLFMMDRKIGYMMNRKLKNVKLLINSRIKKVVG